MKRRLGKARDASGGSYQVGKKCQKINFDMEKKSQHLPRGFIAGLLTCRYSYNLLSTFFFLQQEKAISLYSKFTVMF